MLNPKTLNPTKGGGLAHAEGVVVVVHVGQNFRLGRDRHESKYGGRGYSKFVVQGLGFRV